MKNIKYWTSTLAIIVLMGAPFSSCKKIAFDPPSTKVTSSSVYDSDATAIAVLNGLYTTLSSTSFLNGSTVTLYAGLSADEFTLWSGANSYQIDYFKNSRIAGSSSVEFWNDLYPLIFTCNAAIIGMEQSSTLTPSVKNQLLGEAKFLRALFYFYLTNFYGEVPLVLSTDFKVNALLPKLSSAEVYSQIISDLTDAQGLMADGFVRNDGRTLYAISSAERVRPSKAAATALLARAYLYNKDYRNAEAQASEVISKTTMFDILPLNNVFLKNSREAIWQLQPVLTGDRTNTKEATEFVLNYAPAGLGDNHPVHLSQSLLSSFEPGDQRRVLGNWINIYTDPSGTYYYPFKYKNVTIGTGVTPTEYTMVLRLTEQFLIRAEARARQNLLSMAISDLDMVRQRAGLPLIANISPSITQVALIDRIIQERRVEMFSELGNRWFDLKRTGTVDAVMAVQTPIKGGIWKTHQQLYPIPVEDILRNPNLKQNQGY